MARKIRNYFYECNLSEAFCPVITTSDCEGGSQAFQLANSERFFDTSSAFLTVSAQLHLEFACTRNSGVFTLGPVFRAEKHDSRRHLAEFVMAEVEIPFVTHVDYLIDHCHGAISAAFSALQSNTTQQYHANGCSRVVVTYDDAVDVIRRTAATDSTFQWGEDLKPSHELFLCEYYGNVPVYVTQFPMLTKPFYMKQRVGDNGRLYAECFDLLMPKMGEVVGGGLREDGKEQLLLNLKQRNIKHDHLEWYTNLRNCGNPPTGGYGIGLDRLVCNIMGIDNVRGSTLFPRFYGRLFG